MKIIEIEIVSDCPYWAKHHCTADGDLTPCATDGCAEPPENCPLDDAEDE